MNKDKQTLLAKWLEEDLSAEELQALEQEVDLPALKQVLERQKQFDVATRSNEEMWQDFEKRLPEKSKKADFNKLYWFVGGILTLGIMLGLYLYFNQQRPQKIETPPAETRMQVYADGSQIHLSPKSSIEYDLGKWDSQRKVNLDGQAFFNVTQGAPFIVTTAQGTIEVLGTQFDIWEMGDLMRVQCFKGQVKVTSSNSSEILKENQQIIVNKTNIEDVQELGVTQVDWMQSYRTYQKVPLRWVLKDLERFYNIKTEAIGLPIEDEFGGIIPTDNLPKALEYLTKSLNWTYEIKDKTIYFATD